MDRVFCEASREGMWHLATILQLVPKADFHDSMASFVFHSLILPKLPQCTYISAVKSLCIPCSCCVYVNGGRGAAGLNQVQR